MAILTLALLLVACSKDKAQPAAESTAQPLSLANAPAAPSDENKEKSQEKKEKPEAEQDAPPPGKHEERVELKDPAKPAETSLIDEKKVPNATGPVFSKKPVAAQSGITAASQPLLAQRAVTTPPEAPPVHAAKPDPKVAAPKVEKKEKAPVEDFSKMTVDQMDEISGDLIERIEEEVEAHPSGKGTINDQAYSQKNITIDGVPYEIKVAGDYTQIRVGDPKTNAQTIYYIDAFNDGMLDQVVVLKEKVEMADADFAIKKMEMSFAQPFSKAEKECKDMHILPPIAGLDYQGYWFRNDDMTASIDFKTLKISEPYKDTEFQTQSIRKWLGILTKVDSILCN